jgi:hypothetical protein
MLSVEVDTTDPATLLSGLGIPGASGIDMAGIALTDVAVVYVPAVAGAEGELHCYGALHPGPVKLWANEVVGRGRTDGTRVFCRDLFAGSSLPMAEGYPALTSTCRATRCPPLSASRQTMWAPTTRPTPPACLPRPSPRCRNLA